uniref:Putative mitochondrial import inner membrane translocase subunit tim50 n=1 Tax=Ixodes ricinus TaxID=34613 RepID=A0A147BE99_IXORI
MSHLTFLVRSLCGIAPYAQAHAPPALVLRRDSVGFKSAQCRLQVGRVSASGWRCVASRLGQSRGPPGFHRCLVFKRGNHARTVSILFSGLLVTRRIKC